MSPLDHKNKPSGGSDDLPPDTEIEDEPVDEGVEPSGPDIAFTAIDWTPHAGDAEGMIGAEVIQTLVKRLPNAPGVYRMFDRRRRRALCRQGQEPEEPGHPMPAAWPISHQCRIAPDGAETATMEFVVTRTEIEALLLESNLIKRLRPRFNVLMRDDKSFPYILLSGDHVSPGIYKHRGSRSRKGDYFGPFASAGAVGRTINSLQRAFLLRSCTDSFYENRTRPCLLYQIKRCAGPCTGEISHVGYAELVAEAKDFLSGRSQKVKTEISAAMQQASESSISSAPPSIATGSPRSRMCRAIKASTRQTVDEADVFAIHQEGGQVCIRSSSSAPARTGATGPISPRPTRRWKEARCWARSWRSSTTTSRRRVTFCFPSPSRIRNCSPRRLRHAPAARSPSRSRNAARRRI
jgi:excinuclease ABC subunit C